MENEYEETRNRSVNKTLVFLSDTCLTNKLLDSVYNIDRLSRGRVVHKRFPVILDGKAIQDFIPCGDRLCSFNRISGFTDLLIAVPSTKHNKNHTKKYSTEKSFISLHSSVDHRILPCQPHTSLREEVVAKFKLFYQQNVAFHLEDVLSVEYARVQVFLGQVVYFRVRTRFGQAQANVEEILGVKFYFDLPGRVVLSIRNPVVHLKRGNIIYQVGFH